MRHVDHDLPVASLTFSLSMTWMSSVPPHAFPLPLSFCCGKVSGFVGMCAITGGGLYVQLKLPNGLSILIERSLMSVASHLVFCVLVPPCACISALYVLPLCDDFTVCVWLLNFFGGDPGGSVGSVASPSV